MRVLMQQGFAGEEHAGGTVTALRRAQFCESGLQRMQYRPIRHAFDGGNFMPLKFNGKRKAGEDRFPIDQNGAGPALAQFAAVLGGCQIQVFP
jgi:hypothetical protein